jgi:hypothetical protein
VLEVVSRIVTKQACQNRANTYEARDQRPHVRPGGMIIYHFLIIKNSANASDNSGWNGHTRLSQHQANDEDSAADQNQVKGPHGIFCYGSKKLWVRFVKQKPRSEQNEDDAEGKLCSTLSVHIISPAIYFLVKFITFGTKNKVLEDIRRKAVEVAG